MSVQTIRRRAKNNETVVYSGASSSANLIAVTVADEAMQSPQPDRSSLYPGDILIVAADAKVAPGKLAVIWDAEVGEHMVRKAEFRSRSAITFVALNPAFPPVTLPATSRAILGVVIEIKRTPG